MDVKNIRWESTFKDKTSLNEYNNHNFDSSTNKKENRQQPFQVVHIYSGNQKPLDVIFSVLPPLLKPLRVVKFLRPGILKPMLKINI